MLCINDPTAILSPLTLKGLVPGGAIFMQSPYADPVEVWKRIPVENQKELRDKKVRIYFCDMVRIAREVASEPDLQMRMQGIVLLGAFLKLTPYAKQAEMSDEQVYAGVEKALPQVLRQARRTGRAGQHELHQARLRRDEGDPGGGDQRLIAAGGFDPTIRALNMNRVVFTGVLALILAQGASHGRCRDVQGELEIHRSQRGRCSGAGRDRQVARTEADEG